MKLPGVGRQQRRLKKQPHGHPGARKCACSPTPTAPPRKASFRTATTSRPSRPPSFVRFETSHPPQTSPILSHFERTPLGGRASRTNSTGAALHSSFALSSCPCTLLNAKTRNVLSRSPAPPLPPPSRCFSLVQEILEAGKLRLGGYNDGFWEIARSGGVIDAAYKVLPVPCTKPHFPCPQPVDPQHQGPTDDQRWYDFSQLPVGMPPCPSPTGEITPFVVRGPKTRTHAPKPSV